MEITKPTLILNEKRVRNNIKKMVEKASKSNVELRAHFKTHQSADISKWFQEYGVNKIAVSSIDMAGYFADNGWNDITIAFLVNILQIKQINNLAEKINLGLLIDSFETAEFLSKKLATKVDIWVKVDTAYHRTGIHWDDEATLSKIIRYIKRIDNMSFIGLLTHSGHTYKAKNKEEIKDIYEDTIIKLKNIQERLSLQGFSKVKLSVGDTPSCSIIEDFTGVNEIRPGNFVFYDIQQLALHSCLEKDIAVAVACPVVAKYPERNEIVVYGGAVHLSKDNLVGYFSDELSFGLVALPNKDGWGKIEKDVYVYSLSQEHGIIKAPTEFISNIERGDILYILPIHSCLTANMLRNYVTFSGKELNFKDRI